MKKVKIQFVSKKDLFPYFGTADTDTRVIKVRKDLNKLAKKFVLAHEIGHFVYWDSLSKKDKIKRSKENLINLIIHETYANIYGILRHPIGFIVLNLENLKLYRLRLFFKRLKEGK